MPLVLAGTVLVSGLFAVTPLRNAATLQEVTDVQLVRPLGYVVLAPLSNCLDTLTLLSAHQDLALVLGLVALWALARVSRMLGGRWTLHGSLPSFATLLACIAAVYVMVVFLPRPMAFVRSLDPDILRIDFHSHTEGSRDARATDSVEQNRDWHRAGGYDVAYVTDHGTFSEAERGLFNDPHTGAQGVIVLPGIEANWRGEHVGVLGSERSCRTVLSADLHALDPRGLGMTSRSEGREPVLVWNHPRDPALERLPLGEGSRVHGVRAVEISNGAPYSKDLLRTKRQRIVDLARAHDLALTSGTDNHGWGYTAPNWTLLRIKDWRSLDRRHLATAIEHDLRDGGFSITRVVERTTADAGASTFALSLTVLTVPWRMLTTLSAAERLMWLVWIGIVWRYFAAPGAVGICSPPSVRPSGSTARTNDPPG